MIFEKKIYSFSNMKSYLDAHLRLVHVVPIADPFFQLRAFLVPSLSSLEWRLFRRSGIMGWLWLTSNEYEFWKENFFICKCEIIFEYPFESCTCDPNYEEKCVGSSFLFSQLRVILGPLLTSPEWRLFRKSGNMGLKI